MGKISSFKECNNGALYSTDKITTKLMEGDYYGRHFVILRHRHGHPNAYLEVKPDDWIMTVQPSEYAREHKFDDRYDAASMNVNGGATYFGKAYWDDGDKRTYIGWDYGHCNDYDPFEKEYHGEESDGHKWLFIEIMMDVAHALDGMERDNEDHWEEMYMLPIERDSE